MAEDRTKRIRELVALLREAGRAYYQESREIMSNYEYDRLYDELAALEKETGIVLAQSPTQNVGYEVVSALPRERHESPMLSLNKTKSVEELADWLAQSCHVRAELLPLPRDDRAGREAARRLMG